jgi:magnesium transporter
MRTLARQLPVFTRIEQDKIGDLRARDEFFWLDLRAPGPAELEQLGALFGFHPLALEDTRRFGQRPKLDDYGDHVLLVFFGARLDARAEPQPIEVHLFVSGGSVVTVHRQRSAALDELRRRLEDESPPAEQWVVYRILDALTQSFFPVLDAVDDELDGLEEAIIAAPTDGQLSRIFRLKRALGRLRRVVAPARDLLQSPDPITSLPGLAPGARDYFRDVYDHLLRISELIDGQRDLLSSSMDVYLSTSSNRLNLVMKRLTLIATVFLPLTFVTGFFGQNFGWLVAHLNGLAAFLVLGIGGLALPSIVLMLVLGRSGYLR